MIGKYNSERQDALKELYSNRMEVTEEKSQPMHGVCSICENKRNNI